MPFEWIEPQTPKEPRVLHAWPYRSLPKRGFVIFIFITFLLILLPLFAALGTPVLWGLLPFLLGTLGLLWMLLQRSYKDGSVLEEMRIWPDKVELTRYEPRGPDKHWDANPYWISVELHPKGGPVPNYVTLKGGPREVELGAFLTPEERLQMREDLQITLANLPQPSD